MNAEFEMIVGVQCEGRRIFRFVNRTLDVRIVSRKFALMHRANILLLSSALGLIGRGLLCMGVAERSE